MNNAVNEHCNKVRKEGKTHGNTPPPLKIQCIKRREIQLLGNYVLHSKTIAQTMEFFLSEGIGEDVGSLLRNRSVLQINEPFMNQLPDKMHMDLDMFFPLSLY